MDEQVYQSFWFSSPKGVDLATVSPDLLHDALLAADIGLDGVSQASDRFRVDSLQDPSKAVAALDWSALVIVPPVDPMVDMQAQIDDLKNQIAAAVPALADIAVDVGSETLPAEKAQAAS